jgi:hypothetical protein
VQDAAGAPGVSADQARDERKAVNAERRRAGLAAQDLSNPKWQPPRGGRMLNSSPDIVIDKPGDWQQFRDNKLDVIVDPMVFRAADIFFRGHSLAAETLPVGDSDEIWKAISGDIESLTSFFDQIVMADRLPLIDYGATFDSALGYDVPWICRVVNEELEDRVIYNVHVCGEVSSSARAAAMSELPLRPPAAPQLQEEVRRHLDVLNYQWLPQLHALGDLTEGDLTVARFLYGGLIFSAFSQLSGSGHVLQPKRWRLLTAMSIGASSVAEESEQEMVTELDRRIQANPQFANLRMASFPPILPYLLLAAKPQTPLDLLRAAKELRGDSSIKEYRQWRRDLMRNWVDRGLIEEGHEAEIKRLLAAIQKRLDVDKVIDVELGIGANAGEKGIGVDASVKVPVPAGRIWGWILEQLPGHRYLKILKRLKLAERQYTHMDRELRTVWNGS